jgi:hypothetical protein
MQAFLNKAQKLGLDQTVLNGQKLRNGIQAGLADSSLFFIAAYDFVFNPTDMKFLGIEHLFVQPGAPFLLNLGPNFRPAFKAALAAEGVRIQRPLYETGRMVQEKGVRMLGAANYNLQTKALDLLITHPHGMDYDVGLTSVMPNLEAAFAQPPSDYSVHTQDDIREMRAAVAHYWGSDTWRLGL